MRSASRRTAVYVCTDPGVSVFGSKGSSAHVRAVLTELVRRFDDVHLVTCRTDGLAEGDLSCVIVHELARPRGDTAARECALIALDGDVERILRDIAPSARAAPGPLVYQRYSLWSCAAIELAAQRGWRSVLEINAPLIDEQSRHRALADRATATARSRRAIRSASCAIAVSDGVARWASQLAGRAVHVVPNGVDPARFDQRLQRHRDGEGGDGLTIGFVGTFKPWHDLDTLVETAATLRADPSLPDLHLLLVGDGPELARVRARVDDVGLGAVTELTGAVDAASIPSLLARMDIAVAPYHADAEYFSPIKVFEYLAAGLPVVASAIEGLAANLVDGREALLPPPGDRVAFIAAVRRVCDDGALRRQLAREGREAARTRLGWDRTVDRILEAAAAGAAA